MRLRYLGYVLVVAALCGPASARPRSLSVPAGHSWVRAWHGFVGLFQGFHFFNTTFASDHTLPPPSTTQTIILN